MSASAQPEALPPRFTGGIAIWAGLALVLALSALLRVQATLQTEVAGSIRSDAADYFWYAANLNAFGVYSRQRNPPVAPAPDSVRPPGYPLFIASLMPHPPTDASVPRIAMAQALVGVLVTLLVFFVTCTVTGPGWALGAAALTALSPHLVNAGVYVLTETLYSLSLIVLVLLLSRRDPERRDALVLAAGLVLGASALIRGTSNYLPIVLAAVFFLRWPVRVAWRPAAALLLGFGVAFGPWAWRNAQLPAGADDRLKINMLHHGLYPDFTYEGVPESYGYPYAEDPRSAEIGASMATVMQEIARRFREEPGRHLRWYLLGKPVALWSWHEVQSVDAFVYPVWRSPYVDSTFFRLTHALARGLHWPAVALAGLFCIGVWLPRVQRELPAGGVLTAQVCAAILLYVTALHMAGFPLPRYAVPFRPELYLAACGTLYLASRWIARQRRAERRPS